MKKLLIVMVLFISCKKQKDDPEIVGQEYVYEGDSLTDVATGFSFNYPYQLTSLNEYIANANQINVAKSGERIEYMLDEYASEVRPYKPISSNQTYYFILMAGINDAFAGRSPQQIYNDLKMEWEYAHLDGFKVVAMCISHSTNYQRNTIGVETNKLIKSDPSLYNYLIQTDNLLPDPNDLTYFQPDGIHFTEEGAKVIAREIIETLRTHQY